MNESDLRQLSARIEALEFLVGELAATWVHQQNPGGERRFAEHHAQNLQLKLGDRTSAELKAAVDRLWQQVLQRFQA